MKHKKTISGIGIIILILASGIALAAESITTEKENAINQLLQQRADEVQGAENIIEYISIQDIGTAAQTKYNDPIKGYEVIKEATKQKISEAQQRMLIATPRIWTITDSLTVTTQQKQEQQKGKTGGIPWWIGILVVVFALGGGGLLVYKKRRKNNFTGQILEGIDKIDKKLKEWLNKSYKGINGLEIILKAKNKKIEENEKETASIYQDLNETMGAINRFEGLKKSYESDTPEKFEENTLTFLQKDKRLAKALGQNPEYKIKLLLSVHKNKKLAGTTIADRAVSIQKYNQAFKIRIDRTIELYEKIKKELVEILNERNTQESQEKLKILYDLMEKIPPKDKVEVNKKKILIDRIDAVKEENKEADKTARAIIIYYKDIGEQLKNLKEDITPEERLETQLTHIVTQEVRNSKTLKDVTDELVKINKQIKDLINAEAIHAKKLEVSQEKLRNALAMLENEEKEIKKTGKDLDVISKEISRNERREKRRSSTNKSRDRNKPSQSKRINIQTDR